VPAHRQPICDAFVKLPDRFVGIALEAEIISSRCDVAFLAFAVNDEKDSPPRRFVWSDPEFFLELLNARF
jgi:hypothetical protein